MLFVILLIVEITFLIADIWHEHVNKFLQEKKCQIIEVQNIYSSNKDRFKTCELGWRKGMLGKEL